MGFRFPKMVSAKTSDVPKGYFAVYVGEMQKKRFMVPIAYLNQPLFQDLLSQAEQEFGYHHPTGAVRTPSLISLLASVCEANTNEAAVQASKSIMMIPQFTDQVSFKNPDKEASQKQITHGVAAEVVCDAASLLKRAFGILMMIQIISYKESKHEHCIISPRNYCVAP